MAKSKSSHKTTSSPRKQKSLPTFGVQFFSASKSEPKKYLVVDGGKKIWRDERLLTQASRQAILERLLKSKSAWLKQMAENDLPSCPDTEPEENEANLELNVVVSKTSVESKLDLATLKNMELSPKKQPPTTNGKRQLTYSSKPAATRTPPLNFKITFPVSSSAKQRSTINTVAASPSVNTPAEKRPRESDNMFSSLKKLFSFSKDKTPAAETPSEIVDAEGLVNTRNADLDWQTQGV